MNLRRSFAATVGLFSVVTGAELYARKMEIIRTRAGQATIFRDSIEIRDGTTVITSKRAKLVEAENWAMLCDSVRVQTPEALVRADSVVYDFRSKRCLLYAYPKKQVIIEDESVLIMAVAVEYLITNSMVIAPMGLQAKAKNSSYIISGRSGRIDMNQRIAIIDSEPVTYVTDEDQDSKTVIKANKSRYFINEKTITNEGNVRVQTGAARLDCDTAVYFLPRDSGIAWGRPVIQDSLGFAQTDSIIILLKQKKLPRVTLIGKTEASYQTDNGDTIRLTASSLNIKMENGKITQIATTNLHSGQLIKKNRQLNRLSPGENKNR